MQIPISTLPLKVLSSIRHPGPTIEECKRLSNATVKRHYVTRETKHEEDAVKGRNKEIIGGNSVNYFL